MKRNEIHNTNFLDNTLPDGCAGLIIADPPYFEVKGEFDFIWPSFEDYLKDVDKWARECSRLLADNGTLLWWGHAKKIAYNQIVLDKYLNLIGCPVWEKEDCRTRSQSFDISRTLAPVTERLLMYSKKDELNLNSCVEHIRDYIRNEILQAKGKIVFKEINGALGTATNGGGVASACLSLNKEHPTMITAEMYSKLQKYCNPFLRKEYEELRKEYEELRRPFNNTHKLTDVLKFSQESHITRKYKHPTQKPLSLTRRLMQTCSRAGQLVIVPFAGSGTECEAAVLENLEFIGFDIDKQHCKTANDRVKHHFKNPKLF